MKNLIQYTVVLLVAVLSVLPSKNTVAQVDHSTDLFNQATLAYQNSAFDSARAIYSAILEQGYESANLYYNLGNCYYKMGNITSAILYYEKAKKIDPSDDDITYNLKIAQSAIVDKIEEVPTFFLVTWWQAFLNSFNVNEWGAFSIILLFICFLLLALNLIIQNSSIKASFYLTSLVAFCISLLSIFFAFSQKHKITQSTKAVIFSPSVTAYSTPETSGTKLFVIHEGLTIEITSTNNQWIEVKLPNGTKGWIEKAHVAII